MEGKIYFFIAIIPAYLEVESRHEAKKSDCNTTSTEKKNISLEFFPIFLSQHQLTLRI